MLVCQPLLWKGSILKTCYGSFGTRHRLAGIVVALCIFCATALQSAATQVLSGHVPQSAARAALLGRLAEGTNLDLVIGLPLRNQAALKGLLDQTYDPSSSHYHQYLTPDRFRASFGPTEHDYQGVMDFAKAHGLRVTATHANRTLLDVNGSVADIEKTFHVTLRLYQHPIEPRAFYAPDVEPSVELDIPLLAISGLDNYTQPHPQLVRRSPPAVRTAAFRSKKRHPGQRLRFGWQLHRK
jgi:kumamolisin